MTLVRLTGAGRQFGDRWVLRDVSFTVAQGDRWGIVGRNGVGKTTLFRMLTGEDEPTEGEIWRHPGIRFTLLKQNRGEESTATVAEAALEPFAALVEMERRIHSEAEALAHVVEGTPEAERLMRSYDHHLEEFGRRGGYEMHSRADATLEGLGFPADTWAKPIRALSGGELGRLRLVQTLLAEPDVLLLDEPTNHLDLTSTEWLEGFLKSYPGTVLVVSHDRVFLERLADHVLHLEEGTAFAYTGDFDSFLTQREERRTLQQKTFEKQQAYIARTEDFIRRNLAGQKTKQAKSRRTLLSRLDRVAGVSDEGRAMGLRFGAAQRSGGTVLRVDKVSCAYGPRTLFAPFSAEVSREERIAVIGPNGCGKSTLMRILAGESGPCTGSVTLGTGVHRAYYRQDFTHLDPKKKIREEVATAAPKLTLPELRSHLGRFLFSGDDIESLVGGLSGGEQARVALAKITLQKVNLLLLDEPTNHLDLESREVLEEALEGFDGTMILISHDRAFLSATATRVWSFENGAFHDFAGTFDEWMEAKERSASPSGDAATAAKSSAARSASADAKPAAAGVSKNEQRRREREMEKLEKRIAELEARMASLDEQLGDPAIYAAGADLSVAKKLTDDRAAAESQLTSAYADWEKMGELLAEV
ncbi:MAG TPA: ABC-F family ATP-binding cassette domain-containing protein [Longimicrobiaceae bacterium]|jgi:ATP-binding cassette subfamily F protein 3|nr:ABC-F family ATP-binding cassette domain-containing protein [Longimicrobiaceae bacterium]